MQSKKQSLIAYEDLGAEALRKLYVEDMPLVVIIDSEGNNLYEEGRAEYLERPCGIIFALQYDIVIYFKKNKKDKSPTVNC